MELHNQNGAHGQNGSVKEITAKAAQNGAPVKENGLTPKKEQTNGKPNADAGAVKTNHLKDEKPEVHQPGQPKLEDPKPEVVLVKEETPVIQPTLNLESKLKVVNDLHRRSVQRLNLISRLSQIEAFEVALAQESDELEDNPYQGCKLIIRDDKNREFLTTTPGLIRLVSQFIFSACHEKLAEIEASIVFPKA